MSYFEETDPEEWDLVKAIESKLRKRDFKSYKQLFDSIRHNLERFDNETAANWKQNWRKITQDFLLKLSPTASLSSSHQSTVNFETVNASSFTNSINGDIHSTYMTKRKNDDDGDEDLTNKKQKHLETSVSPEEQPVSSQESQPSLYTITTESTEVNFDIMSPYFFFKEDNISRICFDFRNECLEQELVYEKLPDIKKMAINHVYLVDQDTTTSAIHVQSDFFSQFGLNESYPVLTREDIDTITNINQNLNICSKEKAMDIALKHLIKDDKNPVAKIMYNLLNNYDYAESVYSKDESLFIGRALDPFLNVIFPAGGTMTRDGHFTNLIGNKDLKPDVKYSAKIGFDTFDFLVFEVKCPSSVVKDDLFKISLELQLMINRMIANKINNPIVYGVVGQGFDYDVYRMELVAPLVYLLINVRSFYLPRSTYDLTAALTTIPTLLQLQQLTCNQVYKARKNIVSAGKQHGWTRSPLINFTSAFF